jgi:hypothetical protein
MAPSSILAAAEWISSDVHITGLWRRPMSRSRGTGGVRPSPTPCRPMRIGPPVPRARQVQGQPRRPSPDHHRNGRHPGRNPGPGLVLAGQHQRHRTDPPGQGRHAGLGPGPGGMGHRPRIVLPAEPPLPAARRRALHHRRETPLRLTRTSRPRCPARAAARPSPATCRSRK